MGKPTRAISFVLPVRLLIVMVLCVMSCSGMQKETDVEPVRKKEKDVRQFFRQDLSNENPFYAGLARLYLGSELREGNALIRQALREEIRGAAESIGRPATGITPEIAASEYFKWQMRNWVLVYYLFYKGSRVYPGRLEAETQTRIEELFWNYLKDTKNHTIRRAELRYVLDIHGSENHELMRYSNLLDCAYGTARRNFSNPGIFNCYRITGI